MSEIFQLVRERVPAVEAARFYGLEVKRGGYCSCPFHSEKSPSMHLYGSRFHCFGCGADGDSIDLVARLYDLRPLEAAKKLNADFNLGLGIGGPQAPPDPAAVQHRQEVKGLHGRFESWRERTIRDLCTCFRLGNDPLRGNTLAVLRHETIEHYLELLGGSPADQFWVFTQRREIEEWIREILTPSPRQ